MNRSEVIELSRTRLDDTELPYQFSNNDLSSWVDEAVIEASRRARLLLDSSETIALSSGISEYDLPSGSIFIRRAKITTESMPLAETSYRILDEDLPGWQDATGTPSEYFTDMNTGYFSVYPEPDASFTLELVVLREPILGEVIEIPTRFHYGLIDWVCYRAYQVRDADVENRAKSSEHYALFEQEFGPRSSAKDEVFQLRNRPFSGDDGTY